MLLPMVNRPVVFAGSAEMCRSFAVGPVMVRLVWMTIGWASPLIRTGPTRLGSKPIVWAPPWALASCTAARSEHWLIASAHTKSPGLLSSLSIAVSTVKLAA